ncbi:MAG: 2-C-methyl-D-erythritol 4-phosphate cytidylyltransferase [Caldicoprobacterales bacterium]|jgi:2-C-methyl-D-erythritol 4-phosphate cytidylyltransferase|nr:2-C-methyl-D-erythritol 4-phosphate cytidylyltransferase [Clostridiales bacterium]
MEHSVAAIILAAGKGLRMGGDLPKQYMVLAGRPVLAHTLAAFDHAPSVDALVIVASDESYVKKEVLASYPVRKPVFFVEGGRERQDSVGNALRILDNCELVVIHDGVRPLIKVDVIEKSIAAARLYGACAAGMPCKDTIKEADEEGFSIRTPDRSRLWTIQTPQTFQLSLLKEAHAKAQEDGYLGTDDSSLVERLGKHPVKLIEGGYDNIKITTREDLELAAGYLKYRRGQL